jgi:hypothetical protein
MTADAETPLRENGRMTQAELELEGFKPDGDARMIRGNDVYFRTSYVDGDKSPLYRPPHTMPAGGDTVASFLKRVD